MALKICVLMRTTSININFDFFIEDDFNKSCNAPKLLLEIHRKFKIKKLFSEYPICDLHPENFDIFSWEIQLVPGKVLSLGYTR
jgi:hypothetical protein